MNEACSALEIEFKRVSNDLEYVSHRLESEFRSRCVCIFNDGVRKSNHLCVCRAAIADYIEVVRTSDEFSDLIQV